MRAGHPQAPLVASLLLVFGCRAMTSAGPSGVQVARSIDERVSGAGAAELERAAHAMTVVRVLAERDLSVGLIPPSAGQLMAIRMTDVNPRALSLMGQQTTEATPGKAAGPTVTLDIRWDQIRRLRAGFDMQDAYVDVIKTDGQASRIYFPDQFVRDRFLTALQHTMAEIAEQAVRRQESPGSRP